MRVRELLDVPGLDAARTGDRKLAEAIVTMLASGGGEGAAGLGIRPLPDQAHRGGQRAG